MPPTRLDKNPQIPTQKALTTEKVLRYVGYFYKKKRGRKIYVAMLPLI
jgi:hypothetical protein